MSDTQLENIEREMQYVGDLGNLAAVTDLPNEPPRGGLFAAGGDAGKPDEQEAWIANTGDKPKEKEAWIANTGDKPKENEAWIANTGDKPKEKEAWIAPSGDKPQQP